MGIAQSGEKEIAVYGPKHTFGNVKFYLRKWERTRNFDMAECSGCSMQN